MAPVSEAYRPLNLDKDEIRLLILRPSQNDGIVEVDVVYVFLKDKPVYEALSYVWGKPTVTAPVRLLPTHGYSLLRSTSIEFQVTTNLESALRHIRCRDRSRILWADALCINQFDDHEKMHQIRLMGAIYRQATQVCIWLGVPAGNSNAAMELLEVYENGDPDQKRLIEERPDLTPHWKALFYLVCRPWFTRRWIIQEIALAVSVTIYCGCKSTTWKTLSNAVGDLEYEIRKSLNGSSPGERVPSLFKHWRLSYNDRVAWENSIDHFASIDAALLAIEKEGCMPLSTLLSLFSSKEVSDPRDAVYALLGLAKETRFGSCNFEHSTSVKDVYYNAVELSVSAGRSLDIVTRNSERSATCNLPSWVPPIYDDASYGRMLNTSLIDRGQPYIIESLYSSSGSSLPVVSFNREMYQLMVKGFLVDFVTVSSELPTFNNGVCYIPAAWITTALCLKSMCADGGTVKTGIFTTNEDVIFEAFWRTLVLDRPAHTKTKCTAPSTWDRAAREWREGDMSILESSTPPGEHGVHRTDLEQFQHSVERTTHRRTFIITEGMRMGMASDKVQEGDMIYILLGCSVPVLLRPAASGNEDHFIIVGDVYVHGLMNGEAMDRPEYQLRDVTLV